MTTVACRSGLAGKLQVGKRQSATVLKLMVGSLIVKIWKQITDKNVASVSEETLNGVLKFYRENFTEINEGRFKSYTHFFKRTTYVYVDENEVRGYGLYYVMASLSKRGLERVATLYSFTVDNKYQGLGIGTKILQKSLLEMQLNSIDRVILYVAADNEPAIGLYEKMGFRVTEEVMDVCGPGKQCHQMELFFSN